eukprot:TRINITY_DN5530_c0_g2_i1.p1 TRINITY_DN5530_c0_g2~~TRINITY_DN5530_c0_g2_i1.p1  ORF type:complete len:303 (-),score=35.88 TRINITY_DN5530_c0_g2_i1:1313-2221(-)
MGLQQQLSCEELEVWLVRGQFKECISGSVELLKRHAGNKHSINEECNRCWSTLIQSLYYDNRIEEFPALCSQLLQDFYSLHMESFALWVLYCIQDGKFALASEYLQRRWKLAIRKGLGASEISPLANLIIQDLFIQGLGDYDQAHQFMYTYNDHLKPGFIKEMEDLSATQQNEISITTNTSSFQSSHNSHNPRSQHYYSSSSPSPTQQQTSTRNPNDNPPSLAFLGIWLGIKNGISKRSRQLWYLIDKCVSKCPPWMWSCVLAIAIFAYLVFCTKGFKKGLSIGKIGASFRDLAVAFLSYGI